MPKSLFNLKWLIGLALFLSLLPSPQPAFAQWPPLDFRLNPVYENGRIKYNIRFSSQVEWPLDNLTIKIPLPESTRFVELDTQPDVNASFDGTEVSFFIPLLDRPVINTFFVVEALDPAKTIYITHAWLAWQGEQPGNYLTPDTSLDINRRPLNWDGPSNPRLRLNAHATVTEGIITYYISLSNVGTLRMWDVKVNVPIPAGTTFLSAEVPAKFESNFDGREVSFFTSELERRVENPPLIFRISTDGVTTPFVVTHAWAKWKNVGRSVGRSIAPEEENRSGDIVVLPHLAQQVVSDRIRDVPFGHYDLTSIAMQNEASDLKITFYAAGELGPVGEPFRYILYIDKDCRPETGQQSGGLGQDYRIIYQHDKGQTSFSEWDETQKSWTQVQRINSKSFPAEKTVFVWLPFNLLENGQQFCWQANSQYKTNAYTSAPPNDLTTPAHYEAVTPNSTLTASETTIRPLPAAWGYNDNVVVPAAEASAATTGQVGGKLAVPLDNGRVLYDVHVFSMPEGRELMQIPNARQPNFRFDGQRLLVNHEGQGVENVFEYNLVDGTKRQVGDSPGDEHPSYDPQGNRMVFDNAELIIGANGNRQSFIFVQCGLMPPHQETDPRCRDIPSLGVLVPAGQMGEIQGTHPLWTSNDMIVYKGCNTWAGARLCGIYIVPSSSTKGFSSGFIPRQLTEDTSDISTDSKGNFIVFMSQRDGNWEAYLMDVNGYGIRNLSNSPTSSDGLPVLSPDGTWVAFASDRDGQWAIWVVPTVGGTAQKLFDLPTNAPWGDQDRAWSNERMSWGAD